MVNSKVFTAFKTEVLTVLYEHLCRNPIYIDELQCIFERNASPLVCVVFFHEIMEELNFYIKLYLGFYPELKEKMTLYHDLEKTLAPLVEALSNIETRYELSGDLIQREPLSEKEKDQCWNVRYYLLCRLSESKRYWGSTWHKENPEAKLGDPEYDKFVIKHLCQKLSEQFSLFEAKREALIHKNYAYDFPPSWLLCYPLNHDTERGIST